MYGVVATVSMALAAMLVGCGATTESATGATPRRLYEERAVAPDASSAAAGRPSEVVLALSGIAFGVVAAVSAPLSSGGDARGA